MVQRIGKRERGTYSAGSFRQGARGKHRVQPLRERLVPRRGARDALRPEGALCDVCVCVCVLAVCSTGPPTQ